MLSSPPDHIGPYQVLRPIAQGGMAEVFEVRDPSSGEHLALKLLIQAGSAQPRFDREYEALIRLNHPGIVRVYHYGLHKGAPWLTMELLDGVPLQRRMKTMGRPGTPERTAEVVRVTFLVADALQYIHDRGLVHRDLKSANVLVLHDGRVKLLDFGTAHLMDPVEEITRDGEFVGTFSYASPEQISGTDLDHRSDLYSLGVLLYRLATGRRPFDAPTPGEVARLHLHQAPRPPREIVRDLPAELDALILSLLEKDRDRRPSRADQVAVALEELAGRPLSVVAGKVRVSPQPTVGRDDELRRTWELLESHQPGTTLLYSGHRGSGRLRFTDAVGQEVRNRGWKVVGHSLSARRSDLEEIRAVADEAERVLSAEEPALVPILDEQTPEEERRELLERVAGLLQEVTADGVPAMLLVQQLQRAGLVLVGWLAYVQRAVVERELPVALVLSSEADPASDQRLDAALPMAERIGLEPLGVRSVALAVGSMLQRRPPPPNVARWIQEQTSGDPVYLTALLERMVADGLVRGDDRVIGRVEWHLTRRSDVPDCELAKRHLASDLHALPVSERRLLEALALVDGRATTGVLAQALGCRDRAVLHQLQRLQDRGWVILEGEVVICARKLVGRLLSRELSACRRDLLQRSLADALVASGEVTPARVRLLLATGELDRAVGDALQCALQLIDEQRFSDALEVVEAVVAQADRLHVTTALGEVYLTHATCLLELRPTDMATARSLAMADRLLRDTPLGAQVALARARAQWVIGHYPNHRRYLEEAYELTDVHDDPRSVFTIATHLGQSYVWSGEPRTAGEWYERARDAARLAKDIRLMSRAELGMATWLMHRGDLLGVESRAAESMHLMDRLSDREGFWRALALWTEVLRLQGRFSEALSILYQQLPDARRAEVPSHYVDLVLATARCEVDLCRLGRAQEWVDDLDAMFRKGEHLHLRLDAGLVRGRIHLESGQLREAGAVFQEVYQRARAAHLPSKAELARARHGEILWYLGERDEADESFRAATLGLMGIGDKVALAEACVVRARAAAESANPSELFGPVAFFLQEQPAIIVRLEVTLARARWLTAQRRTDEAAAAWREAAKSLNDLSEGLNDMDRAALRVHPWSRFIRRGLR